MEGYNLEDAIAMYLAHHDNAETARAYRQTLARFADGYNNERPRNWGIRPIQSFTVVDLDVFDNELKGRGLASATLMSHRRRIKAFWNWCVKRKLIPETPASEMKIKRRRVSMASKAIPSDVLREMLNRVGRKREFKAAVRDTAILGLMVTYGARRSDVIRTQVNNVNLRESWIVLHTKGNYELRLPLPPILKRHLAAWLDLRATLYTEHPYVFTVTRPSPGGVYTPLTAESVSTMIKRLSESVCGHPYGPHAIRHWFGQYNADNRIPPTLLRDLMGHSDVKITLDHYYNQDFDRMRTVLNSTDMARDLVAAAGTAPQVKSNLVFIDFKHGIRVG